MTGPVDKIQKRAPGRPSLGLSKKTRLVAYVKSATRESLYSAADLRGEEVGEYLDALAGVVVNKNEAPKIKTAGKAHQR
jgi:hypothetical protein